MSISTKRPRSLGQPARRKKAVLLAVGGTIVVVAVLALLAYLSRPAPVPRGPELGEHLHSLLTYGTQGTILVGTHGVTARSTDGGKTLVTVGSLDGIDAMESGADRSGKLIVIAGHNGAKLSRDGGQSWSDVTGLPGDDVHGFGLDATDPKHWFAYVVGHGVFLTTDEGASWKPLAAPPAEPTGDALLRGGTILIPALPSGLLRSTDGGASWNVIDRNVGGMALAADPRDPHHLYLSGGGPLFVSADDGRSWSERQLPEGVQVVTPMSDGTLLGAGYTADHRAVLVRSRDGGATWSAPA